MWMATRSNSGESLNSMMNRHAINFQFNTSPEMVPMSSYFGMDMINSVANSGLIQTGNSSNSSNTSMATEWSDEEQYKLEDGLEKYKDKPSILKYIKIAATLRHKSIRDVALRCRWMTRKRRKAEELHCGKRTSSNKDKQVELLSSSKSSIPYVLPDTMTSYPFLTPFSSSDLSGNAMNLLEQNVRTFSQIRSNLSSYKVEDNIDLFFQTRNNLITIQNEMKNMPGLMSQMPPLPVAINDDLSVTTLSNSTFAIPFKTMQSCGFNMKQEPLG